MLELKNIKKSYKTGDTVQEVLKGININFRKNEFTSILGSSGSGKTTLLNIIGGLDKYDDGDLIIEGVSTKNYKDRDWDSYRNYRVGFIFQSYNLIMHQTVYSNVEIALTLSGVSKAERKKRVLDVIEKVGLKEHAYKKPNQLSGGQMQRVAIARALVNNPEIILADEPTGALDSVTSVQIMELLKEIASDKLVIMVTHNPELAKEYSTRIIELKDGVIINDDNPYNGEGEQPSSRKITKTAMSFMTSLSLSFNNLLTKKGRTFLTAFAGSIGIIGIALILSLANGVSQYVANLEKDSLTDYPITIDKTSEDIMGLLSNIGNLTQPSNENREEGKLYSKDDMVSSQGVLDSGIIKKNNTREFKKYLDNNSNIKQNAEKIVYKYNIVPQVYTKDYLRVNPSELKQGQSKTIFKEVEEQTDKMQTLSGTFPKNKNEIVLIADKDGNIQDSVLYSLGIKDMNCLTEDIQKYAEDQKYKVETKTYTYDDFIGKTYKVILNTDYYKEENGMYLDYSNDKEYMKGKIDNGLEVKIVGIVKDENSVEASLGYTSDLTKYLIEEIGKTSIAQKQIANKTINALTGKEFDGITSTYEDVTEKLGIYEIEDPSSISIYPKNYDAKQEIVKAIDQYNEEKKANNQNDLVINYSDTMKSLISGVTGIINMVSFVLIGFVAISLIVSSIMIAIITYISVLERTKEIGILRAIGASKKDIKRVFRAETIIEGLIAGLLGVGITILLTFPINALVSTLAKIDNVASLPIISAVVLILLSVLLNVIAGSKPSSMASKKDPVEALRTE